MRVFVAGGTGVIGRRLVPQLVTRDGRCRSGRYGAAMRAAGTFAVTAFARLSWRQPPRWPQGSRWGCHDGEAVPGEVVGRSATLFHGSVRPGKGRRHLRRHGVLRGHAARPAGAFNFVHSSTTSGSDRTAEFFTIVPSSGTGDLAGISGGGGLAVDADGTHRVWFDYELG